MGQRNGSAIASSTLAQASALFHIKENRTIACPSRSNLESSSNLPTQPNPQQPAGNSLQPHSCQFAASPVLVFQLSPPPKPSPRCGTTSLPAKRVGGFEIDTRQARPASHSHCCFRSSQSRQISGSQCLIGTENSANRPPQRRHPMAEVC